MKRLTRTDVLMARLDRRVSPLFPVILALAAGYVLGQLLRAFVLLGAGMAVGR